MTTVPTVTEHAHAVLGSHFDGSTLVGFIGTVGLVALLADELPGSNPAVCWRFEGRWLPSIGGMIDPGVIADAVVSALRRTADLIESLFPTDSDLTISRFRELVGRSFADPKPDASILDWLAAIGVDRRIRTDESDAFETTPFKSLGSGRQRFMPTLIEVLRTPDADAIDRCLRDRDACLDGTLTLRWDPRDDRRHAYRWRDPSRDPIRSSSAMNALAVSALRLFPTAPSFGGLVATGFRRARDGWEFTWPLWTPPIDVASIRHLVAHPELVSERPKRTVLQSMGVADVFRVRRLVVDRYVNFSPSCSP